MRHVYFRKKLAGLWLSIHDKKTVVTVLLFSLLIFSYQNCGDVSVVPIKSEKLSCDSSVYNIAREANTTNGQTVYFVQENNHDISNEYSGRIQWTVNGVIQTDNVTHDNRLLLNCETHPENIEIKASLISDCQESIEIVEEFSKPDTCVEDPETPNPPGGDSVSYCEEYKQKYPGVENVPGFTTSLEAIDMKFEEGFVWDNQLWEWDGDRPVPSFEAFMLREPLSGATGLGRSVFFKAPLRGMVVDGQLIHPGMRMKYIAIPLKVPESSPYGTLSIPGSMNYMTIVNGAPRVSISPCKGDFRFRDQSGIGQSTKASPYCIKETKGDDLNPLRIGFNETTTQNCYIPKGKTVWLNIAFYTFNSQVNPNLPPIPDFESGGQYTCSDVGSLVLDAPQFLNSTCGFWAPSLNANVQ